MKLTHERVRELLDYEPLTGQFTWKKATNRRMKKSIGAVAGCVRPDGYLVIGIDGESILAHRLAWFWMHAQWPVDQIDHKTGIKTANAEANLREATSAQNLQNKAVARSNSGFMGVSWSRRDKRFVAAIKLQGKRFCLGYYRTAPEASTAYVAAKLRLHPFAIRENFDAA